MPIFIPLMCLLGMGLARFRGRPPVVPANPAARDDGPVRLLRWAVGLLPEQRDEWGRAMLGELGYVDGRGRRWRFAVGCAGAALLLPPWGRAAAVAGRWSRRWPVTIAGRTAPDAAGWPHSPP